MSKHVPSPSCSSAARTSASRRCSIESPARGAPSSRPSPGRRATRSRDRSIWRGTGFKLFDTGGMFGASEDPLHELVVRQGQRAIVGADLIVFVVDGREGARARRRGDCRRAPRHRQARSSWRSTRPTTNAPARGAFDFFGSASSRCSRCRPSMAKAWRICWTKSFSGLTGRRRQEFIGDGARPVRESRDGDRGRHRRPAERRQVFARQSASARRARARQRHAGHDARRDRRDAHLAQAPLPHRGYGGHAAAGPGRARRARWRSSASRARSARSWRRTSSAS